MQKRTSLNPRDSSLPKKLDQTSMLYKRLKTALICFAFLVMGSYTEIIGLTMPDLKLQFRLYESHKSMGIGSALSSVSILLGFLFVLVAIVFFDFKTKCSVIFNYSSKIDFLLSISFFCAATGVVLMPFARDFGIDSFYVSCSTIGLAQGVLLLGGSLLLMKIWLNSDYRIFHTHFRFLIIIFYSTGAALSTLLTHEFLVPLVYDYRDYYKDTINDTRSYLRVLDQITTRTTTRPTRPTRPTPRTQTTSAKPLPDLIMLDFLRYDSNDLYDENNTMHRLFAQNFFHVFYVVAGLCACVMAGFFAFYVIELRIASKSSEIEHHELSSSMTPRATKAITPVQKLADTKPLLKRLKSYFVEKLNSDLLGYTASHRSEPTPTAAKPNKGVHLWNAAILIFSTVFYTLAFACHKIQSTFLATYSVQAEYLRKTLQNNEIIIDIEPKIPLIQSNWSSFISFTEPYPAVSLSLIDANYTLTVYYAGLLAGALINLSLIINFYYKNKLMSLVYANCTLHLASRLFTLAFASSLVNNSTFKTSTLLVWMLANFFNGLFISSLPALVHEFLTSTVKNNQQFTVLSRYHTLVELLSLSLGVSLFQYLVGLTFDLNKNFNSFVNILFGNSFAMLLVLVLVHTMLKYIPRKYRLINPT